MRAVGPALLLLAACVSLPPRDPGVMLHLIGDSTMADKPDPDRNPERGWGQALREFTITGALVRNHAVNGRSSRSFIDEGRWEAVRRDLQPNDYVWIQFGHNDQKIDDARRYAAPHTTYRANLERFVRETREAGAVPVLFTSIVRRRFDADGVLQDTHGDYPLVVRAVARDLDVPLVDLQQASETLVRQYGPIGSRALFVHIAAGEYPAFPAPRADDTHLSPRGATEIARLAVRGVRHAIPALRSQLRE